MAFFRHFALRISLFRLAFDCKFVFRVALFPRRKDEIKKWHKPAIIVLCIYVCLLLGICFDFFVVVTTFADMAGCCCCCRLRRRRRRPCCCSCCFLLLPGGLVTGIETLQNTTKI